MKHRPLWPLLLPVAVSAMAAVTMTVIHLLKKPGTTCAFQKATGLHCPGCGGTRCMHDLMYGDLLGALSHNAMLFTGILLFGLMSCYLIIRITILGKPAPRMPNIRPIWIWYGFGVIVLFTALRNIPSWPFNLLAP